MRLLAVIPEYPPVFSGGIATYYKEVFPILAKLGMDITILVPASNQSVIFEGSADQEVKVKSINNNRVVELQNQFKGLSVSPDITRLLASAWAAYEQTNGGEGFDLVECTDWGLYFVPWLLANSRPPVVVRLHGSGGQISFHDSSEQTPIYGSLCQLIETALLPRAEILTTYSTANQKAWERQLSRDVEYIPPPLNLSLAASSEQEKDNCGLVVGRVQPWKGTATLCAALRLMGSKAPSINWIGRSVYSHKTKTSFDKQLAEVFPDVWGTFLRHLPPEPPHLIREKQARAKFVIVPSDWDVYNFTVAEAMAQQAVVICSRGAGASDLIEHGINGFLFDAKDAHMLADIISHVQSIEDDERKAIGYAARATVEKNLSPNHIALLTLEQYESAINKELLVTPKVDLIGESLSPNHDDDLDGSALELCLERFDLKFLARHVASRLAEKVMGKFLQ